MADTRPLGVRIEDLTNNITNAINDSGLPVYVTELVLLRLMPEVTATARAQMQEERQKFYKAEEEENDNDE